MKIAFYPTTEKGLNEYTEKIIEAIKKSSEDAEVNSFPSNKKILSGKIDFDVAWLNWFENFPTSNYQFFKQLILRILDIKAIKSKGKRIYTVFHNKQPHESNFPKLNKWFYKFLLRKSDRIIILSDESKKFVADLLDDKHLNKTVKISHPAYEIRRREKHTDTNDKFTALFFGLLRPYKNIELIIQLAKENPDINFIIAGKPLDETYELELKGLCNGIRNITLIPKFQNDDDIEGLIDKSSIVLLPYNIYSSLNSGVLFYSLSKGINVIIPEIPSVGEFKNKDLIYHYFYNDEEEHLKRLQEKLNQAKMDYFNSPEDFMEKALTLQKEVSQYDTDYLVNQIKSNQLV